MNRFAVILLLCLLAAESPVMSQNGNARILARAGETAITEAEFLERFELLPHRNFVGTARLQKAKEELLISLVAEKLLAQAAREVRADKEDTFIEEMRNVRRLLARDELYRDQIQRKISVTDREISEQVPNARTSLLVEYLFSPEKRPLMALVSRARDSVDIWRHLSAAGNIVYDTITVNWGEAESQLEETVYALEEHETSRPVKASMGWFICRVIRSYPNAESSGLGIVELRERIKRTLRSRKERKKLDEYITSVMRTASSYSRPESFRALTTAIRMAPFPERDTSSETERYSVYRRALSGHEDDTLLVMNSHIMTIGQVLTRMHSLGMQFTNVAYPVLEWKINSSLKIWAWQSILEDIALEKALDARPAVQHYIGMWEAHYLSEAFRRYAEHRVKASTLDAYRVLETKGELVEKPMVDLVLVWSASLPDLYRWTRMKDEKDPKATATLRDRIRTAVIHHADILSQGALGDSLWTTQDGTWSTPVRTDSGFVMGKLVRRNTTPHLDGSTIDSLKRVATSMKARRYITESIARLAAKRGFVMFEDQLSRVKVSSTPMMSFRMLGFGGRMFAVPFVRPQLDWIELLAIERQLIP